MNSARVFLHGVRWLSAAGLVAVLLSGFIVSLSLIQAFMINPLLMLVCLCGAGYATNRLNQPVTTAEIHCFYPCRQRSKSAEQSHEWMKCG